MGVSYNNLFKLLIDKGMKKTELRYALGISPNTMAKLSKNENVSMEVIVKICEYLDCEIQDVVTVVDLKGRPHA